MSPEQIRAARLARLEAENENPPHVQQKRVTRYRVEPDRTLHELIESQGKACAMANWPWYQRYFTVSLWYRYSAEQDGDYRASVLVERSACTSTDAAIEYIAASVRKGELWALNVASDIENLLQLTSL